MRLLIGLGNPGPRYEVTRHNVGFLVVDDIAKRFGVTWSGEKFLAQCGKGHVLSQECLLLKPMTFMNLSGRSVVQAMRFFKLSPQDIVVLHDDIDVPAGKVKARLGGGHGGHNGIRSIIDEIGSADFHRVKLGVGRPSADFKGDVAAWVLGPMTDPELLAVQGSMFDETIIRLENIFKQ